MFMLFLCRTARTLYLIQFTGIMFYVSCVRLILDVLIFEVVETVFA